MRVSRRARENPIKTRDKVLIGAGGATLLGLGIFFLTRPSKASTGGAPSPPPPPPQGSQTPIGSTNGQPPAKSFGDAGLPAPTGKTTTNPLTTGQGAQQALQNPQAFLQDVSNFINGAAAFKQGFQIVNTIYSAIQSFAASNLNYYLPALDPSSFGFVF